MRGRSSPASDLSAVRSDGATGQNPHSSVTLEGGPQPGGRRCRFPQGLVPPGPPGPARSPASSATHGSLTGSAPSGRRRATSAANTPPTAAAGSPARLRTALATVCISGALEDKLAAAAAAGFDGVEIFEPDFVASSWSAAQVRERCADLGLSIDLYQPFRDFDSSRPEILQANLRRADRKFDVMEELGTDLILVCSSVAPDALDDDDRIAEQLHQLATRADDRGLRVSYEALAWGQVREHV